MVVVIRAPVRSLTFVAFEEADSPTGMFTETSALTEIVALVLATEKVCEFWNVFDQLNVTVADLV